MGRMMRMVMIAGAGALAWRWWKNRQAEDREYSFSGDSYPGDSEFSRSGPAASGRAGGFSGTPGMTSSMGANVNEVPAQ